RVLVDEDAVLGEQIRVVVAVVRAGVDAVRVTVDQLGDLEIVERGQLRGRLRLSRRAAELEAAGEERGDGAGENADRQQASLEHPELLEVSCRPERSTPTIGDSRPVGALPGTVPEPAWPRPRSAGARPDTNAT